MPTFSFDLWDGKQITIAEVGLDLSGPETAFKATIRGVRDMFGDAGIRTRDASAWTCQVRDETGTILFTVPFSIAPLDRHYVRHWRLL